MNQQDPKTPETPSPLQVSFYPGCSLATTARENLESLYESCRLLGVQLNELPDWNCCGSSSAPAVDRRLALELPARNLTLAPPGLPLMAACPSCHKNLRKAQWALKKDPRMRTRLERRWGREIPSDLKIVSFLTILRHMEKAAKAAGREENPFLADPDAAGLNGLKIAAYYGCMLHEPAEHRSEEKNQGLMEKTLTYLKAKPLPWNFGQLCCGTFLTVTRTDVTTPLVNRILAGAEAAGAECVVTACSMCQLNLEIRCSLPKRIPVLHFSEVLAMALGAKPQNSWFARHLVDPRPLFAEKGLL